jgi:hypothetical protein
MSDINPFITSGTVPHNSPVYITRKEELVVFRYLKTNQYVTILGARQTGKTTLLHRIHRAVQSEWGYASALVDLSSFNSADLTMPEWMSEFCTLLVQSLNHFFKEDFSPPLPKTMVNFKGFLAELAAHIQNPQILLFFDEASAIPGKISNPFYSTIRSIFTDRGAYPPAYTALGKYNFVFAGVFEPEKLIKESDNSPFNISKVIYLPDFSLKETNILFANIEKITSQVEATEIGTLAYELTSGHPHLSQHLAFWLVEEILSGLQPGSYNEIVRKVGNRLPSTVNVKHVTERATEPEYMPLLKRILSGELLNFNRGVDAIAQLELIGAISESKEGKCQIRNNIYKLAISQAVQILAGKDEADASSTESDIPKDFSQRKLLEILTNHFDDDELRDVCFILRDISEAMKNLYYENLPGGGKRSKCRELITYADRHGFYSELVELCYKARPKANWR